MADDTPSVSVTGYLAGLAAAIVLGTLAYGFVLVPLLFGDAAFVQDTSRPDSQMQAIGPGFTLPTVLGIAFVTVVAVAHGWLYVNYPRLLDGFGR
ncbi:hypothetical protein [Haloarchaeobius sp. HME9146]|uniref:hypothetical protein n=1 Tax=Haloarchaeobius sp. HME9146 TaxID=2978732 RepID=UPI0021C0A042|nr:hypothetical protein [Haloarchaeobius sp. HME9146]MCT9095472.1 hypothetical protein [Haloarchaeobius sp. HME9146]